MACLAFAEAYGSEAWNTTARKYKHYRLLGSSQLCVKSWPRGSANTGGRPQLLVLPTPRLPGKPTRPGWRAVGSAAAVVGE